MGDDGGGESGVYGAVEADDAFLEELGKDVGLAVAASLGGC